MSETTPPFNLTALDGANPLGFLAALGTLAVLSETDPHHQTRLARQERLDALSYLAQSTRKS